MKAITLLAVGAVAVMAGCETVNSNTVKDMPTGYLCDMLGPDWVSLPSERKAIYAELEKRGAQCVVTRKIILEDD